MVQKYKTYSQFDIPYPLLCPVYFLRYPNALATHVISVDVLSREIISRPLEGVQRGGGGGGGAAVTAQQQHVLKTTRLILKRGTLPDWAPRGVIRNAESWVLEESEVDLDKLSSEAVEERKGVGREMKSWTRNLDHTTVMAVTERNVFRERWKDQVSDTARSQQSDSYVNLKAMFDVTSGISFGLLRSRIEKFGLNRVRSHVDTSQRGILSTYSQFLEQRLGVLPSSNLLDPLSLGPTSTQASKRARLLAALRPPFLDGDFVGPIARMKRRLLGIRDWWSGLDRGGSGDEGKFQIRTSSQKEIDEQNEGNLSPSERLRKRFLKLRDQRKHPLDVDEDDE